MNIRSHSFETLLDHDFADRHAQLVADAMAELEQERFWDSFELDYLLSRDEPCGLVLPEPAHDPDWDTIPF